MVNPGKIFKVELTRCAVAWERKRSQGRRQGVWPEPFKGWTCRLLQVEKDGGLGGFGGERQGFCVMWLLDVQMEMSNATSHRSLEFKKMNEPSTQIHRVCHTDSHLSSPRSACKCIL